jgi:hypothetical protein
LAKKKKWQAEIRWQSPESLTPWAKNAKIHSTEQIDKIAQQIAAVGFTQPIVIDAQGVIIAGHGRREASIRLGLKKVPVVVADHLDEYQSIAARIADNKVAEAPWDTELLKFDLGTLKLQEFNLDLTGFDMGSIGNIFNPIQSENTFTENDQRSVSERAEQYENSQLRQMILVMDPEEFEQLMKTFAELQEVFEVETNLEVVQKLVEHYASNRN